MKDNVHLRLTGIVATTAAWGFWHYLGEQALIVLLAVVLLELLIDNRRLRLVLS
jgi:hypothetical protein